MAESESAEGRFSDPSVLEYDADGPAPASSQAATRFDPAVARADPSTPGPHAPNRATLPDPIEQERQQRAAETDRLPPIPGYDVQQFIGRGGMGIVYRAVHLATGRVVALKLVNPSGARDTVTRDRFDREVRTLAALKHPNIVPVYDAGEWHGFPYCAMEFVAGGTLGQHLDRVRADLRGAVRLMAKVARAVAAMHAAGILHRDLKPLNILLGPGDEPMVADFGLVRRSDDESDLTNSGLPLGTRLYMAPEQTRGRRADYAPACDIWALGVTLYEVLTGRRPFADDGASDLSARIRSEEAPPIAVLAPAVPAELAAVVGKCLQKRPENRYAAAAAVADDLERWLAGEPVTAPPVPEPVPAAVFPPESAKASRYVRMLLMAAGVMLLTISLTLIRWSDEQPEPPPKSLTERVAAGEKVKLTDEKGIPTVPLTLTEGHELSEQVFDGYHGFVSKRIGIASLANEVWGGPIRVEADVAIYFSLDGQPMGGVYVGRRVCTGSDLAHESLVYCGATPRFDAVAKKRLLSCSNGQYWWTGNQGGGATLGYDSAAKPWSDNNAANGLRFAHLVIDVLADEVRTTGDGVPLRPITEKWALRALDAELSHNPNLRHTFTPPAFGTGIGVFCRNTECVVANLTVSRLDP